MRKAIALAAILALPVAGVADPGAVDWGKKVVKCTGSGAGNLRDADGNVAVARIGAEKAAKLDALRNCMEALKGVQLESGKSVGSALESDKGLTGRVEGLVRGFRVVGKPRYFSDGGVEMDVEVPLEGKLSDALLPRGDGKAAAAPASDAPAVGTALVVDARGQKVTPALAPRVLDESGNEVYGPAMLSETGRKAGGGAAYAKDLASAQKTLAARLGDKPVVVKAVKVAGSDVVISSADAASLSGKNLGFLADAHVVILAD
jgi:hypothetical protein